MKRRDRTDVVTVRRAGLVAGVTLLVMAISAPFAEFYAMPRLLVEGSPAETVANLTANRGTLLAGLFGYLITYAGTCCWPGRCTCSWRRSTETCRC